MSSHRRVTHIGRVNGGRPPTWVNQLRETNDLRAGVNMSGVIIGTVVVVVVVMQICELFVMQARGE